MTAHDTRRGSRPAPEREEQEGQERQGAAPGEGRRLFSSGSALILGRLTTATFGWAGSVIMVRSLTGEEWGQYSFVFALLGILDVVTDLGVGRVVLARLGSGRAAEVSRIAGSFIMLRILLGFLGYLIAVAYVYLAGLSVLVLTAAVLAGTTVLLATPANALFVLYQSRLRLTYVAVWDIIGQCVQFLLIVLVALTAPGVLAFILPAIVREIVIIIGRGIGVPKLFAPGFRPSFRSFTAYWGEMLREAVPISIGLALLTMLERIDTLMLEQLDTYGAVGQYAIGYKFSDLLWLVVSALAIPFTTVLIRAWPHDPETFRARFHQALSVAAVLGGGAVVVFWPSAAAVITLLYGSDYLASATAAALLVTGSALSGLNYVVVTALIAATRLRVFPWLAAAGLVLNVALNLVLIPLRSIEGAAIATVITQVVVLVAMLLLLRGSLRIPGITPWSMLLRLSLLSAAVAVPAVLLVGELRVPGVPAAVGAGLVYLLLVAATERRATTVIWRHLRARLRPGPTAAQEGEPDAS